ncbi:hypothetical protein J2W35_001321 [Variovorax boronicumulans]|uniref:hypothetical protein n=1 Tax=Variovorax boronicumulans TaxID=436515 RepID=UPI002786AC14|nr:hypothetical protein [Variovorax boronicumulans]MDQ0080984.1 hypothetical protein [Variovorax boronicumulans]
MKDDVVQDLGASEKGHPHVITIEVDGNLQKIEQGKYLVSALKAVFGIPPDYELDQVVGGKFIPLADGETIQVHPHEKFVSHVRHGGSS